MPVSKILVTLVAIFVLCGSAKTIDIHFELKVELISNVQKYFYSGCVMIVHIYEGMGPDLETLKYVHEMQRTLMVKQIPTSVLDIKTLHNFLRGFMCTRNRPLLAIHVDGEIARNDLQQLLWSYRDSVPRWLFFLNNTTRVENYFGDVDIPFDCELLVAQMSCDKAVSLTEVYRVSGSLPLHVYCWGSWNPLNGLQGPLESFYERRRDLEGIILRAAAVHDPPMSYLHQGSDGELISEGAFIYLWYEIAKKVNFKMKIFKGDGNMWGSMRNNGSWSGIMGMVTSGRVDVGLSSFYMTSARLRSVSFTLPIQITEAHILIQTPEDSSSKWSMFLSPFSVKLWLAMIGFILFFTCSLAGLRGLEHWYVNGEKHGPINKYFQDSFICVWGHFCAQGHWTVPQSLSTRQIQLFIFLTAFTLLCAYLGKFVANLTISQVVLPFTDLKGLLDDHSYNFVVQAQNGFYTHFQNTTDPILRMVYKKKIVPMKKQLPHTATEGLARLCKEQLAFMTSSDYYMLHGDKQSCHLSIIPHASYPMYHAYVLHKNSPYLGIINHNLLKMHSSGIVREIYLTQLYRRIPEYEPLPKSVGMKLAAPILSLSALGIVACMIVLLMEIKLCQKKKSLQILHV